MPTALRRFLINNPRLVHRAARLIPNVQVTRPVRPVGPMRMRLRLNKGYWLHDQFETEKHQLGIIKSLIRPGDTVFDIGCNIGYVLRFMVGNCGAGKAFAFEPVPFNRELLEQNIRIGGMQDRVTLLPYAIGDTDGRIEFTLDDYTGATGAIDTVKNPDEGWQGLWGVKFTKIEVPVFRIDTLMERGEVSPPRLMKVDIEGAEEFFVKGAEQTLRAYKPRLVMELHTLEQARNTMRALEALGYVLFGHARLDDNSRARRYTLKDIDAAGVRDDLPFHLYATPEAGEFEREIPPYEG
jgi:FkbM family methyltransferase